MSMYVNTQSEQYGQYAVKPAAEMMMLGVGQPSHTILNRAKDFIILHEPEGNNINVLQYGLKKGFYSYRKFVQKLICDLTDTDEIDFSEENIYMTNGISQSVFMLASLLRSTYDTVFVEELTYFIMINVFKDLKYDIKTFNNNNLDKLKEDLKGYPNGALIYVIPFCNNPTGKSMTNEQIKQFVHVIPNNCVCLSDETYQFLQNNNIHKTLNKKCLALYADNIISLGTFSKILAPAVRLGWMYTNYQYNHHHFYKYIDETGFMDSGGSVNPIMAYMITNYIDGNYDAYKNFIQSIRYDLHDKQQIIIDTLSDFTDYFEVMKSDGGYFLFVKSLKINSTRLLELAQQCCLSFHIGNKFAPNKDYDDWFRFSVSYYSKKDFSTYFAHRIQNLVKLIDLEVQNRYEVSLFGFGRLGKLIDSNLNKTLLKYNILTRNFCNEVMGDIIIDITSSSGTIELINFLIEKKINKKLIIGTTGHTQEEIVLIKTYSKTNAVILCPNFSNGIQNLVKMIRTLDNVWKSAHILDIHHIHKKDAPSGTALLLKRELENKAIATHIDSRREGEIIGTHVITLKGENEELILTHKAENRDIFASGCINLIEKIKELKKGLYDFV